jgi:hypothetical protein
MAKYLKSDYYSCSCSSPEHVVTFTWWHKDDDALNMNIHLAKHPFYKRVVNAIKYVFGYSCQYGHFDEFLIDRDTAKKMTKMLNEYVKGKKE